jgi:hypothetical protein
LQKGTVVGFAVAFRSSAQGSSEFRARYLDISANYAQQKQGGYLM